jgi:hypothetical protein
VKALTILQPWASLIVHGEKKIETRSWSTRHRGLLAIHASARPPRWMDDLWNLSRFAHALRRHDIWHQDDLPLGAVVGVVDIVDIVDFTIHPMGLDQQEATFGDYSHGRFGWVLKNPLAADPVPARGAQGLWNWDLTTAHNGLIIK